MSSLKSAFFTVYLGYVFRYACLIVLIPFYARVLGPSEYGQVLVASALGNFVWAIQNWGFAVVGARNVAASQDAGLRQLEFSRHISARLLLLPLSLGTGLVGTLWSPVLREDPWLGAMATMWGILSGCNLGWYFQGIQDYRASVTAEIINFGMTLLLVLVLVGIWPDARMAITGFLLANVVATLYAYGKARETARLVLSSVADATALLKESFALFINASANALISNGGTYVLGLMSTPAQAAFYGTAERMVTTVLGLLVPAGQVLLPKFSRMSGQTGQADALKRQQRQAIMWVTFAGVAAMLGALILGPWVLPWVLGANFSHSVDVLLRFSPLFVLFALSNSIAVYVLLPMRLDRWVSAVGVVGALLNIGLMFLLARDHGANGIALGRVGVELLVVLMLVLILRQHTRRA